MSLANDLSKAIADRLTTKIYSNRKVTVALFDDRSEDYDRVQRYSRVFVFCPIVRRTTTTPVAFQAPLEHKEAAQITIIIQSCSLSRRDGAYEMDEEIAAVLDNWEPFSDGRSLYRGDFKFQSLKDGVWEYTATYTLNTRSQAPRIYNEAS